MFHNIEHFGNPQILQISRRCRRAGVQRDSDARPAARAARAAVAQRRQRRRAEAPAGQQAIQVRECRRGLRVCLWWGRGWGVNCTLQVRN